MESSLAVRLRLRTATSELNAAMSHAQNRSDPWRPAHNPDSLYSQAISPEASLCWLSTYSMVISPVMKQYTKTPQHTVRPANDSNDATCPPQVSVSPVSLRPARDTSAPATRHTTDTTTPANATSALTIDQLLGYGGDIVGTTVKVAGVVKDGTLTAAGGGDRFALVDAENPGSELAVLFDGALSEEIADGSALVLTGSLDEQGRFSATDVALEG